MMSAHQREWAQRATTSEKAQRHRLSTNLLSRLVGLHSGHHCRGTPGPTATTATRLALAAPTTCTASAAVACPLAASWGRCGCGRCGCRSRLRCWSWPLRWRLCGRHGWSWSWLWTANGDSWLWALGHLAWAARKDVIHPVHARALIVVTPTLLDLMTAIIQAVILAGILAYLALQLRCGRRWSGTRVDDRCRSRRCRRCWCRRRAAAPAASASVAIGFARATPPARRAGGCALAPLTSAALGRCWWRGSCCWRRGRRRC